MKRARTSLIFTEKHQRADLRSFIKENSILEKAKVDRINELGRIAKTRPLTEAETEERAALREEYLKEVRAALKGTK